MIDEGLLHLQSASQFPNIITLSLPDTGNVIKQHPVCLESIQPGTQGKLLFNVSNDKYTKQTVK